MGMGTAVVAGVATGIAITEAEKNNKKYQEEQAKLPGYGEKCADKCKKDFMCYNEKCLSNTEYNIATSPPKKAMDSTTLALIIVLPVLTILLILAGFFEPQIREFFKKTFKR